MRARIFPVSVLCLAAVALSGCGAFSWFGGRGGADETVAGELVPNLTLSAEAARDYSANYSRDPSNKAFAVSPSGAFGVAFGASTVSDAERGALEKCMQDVRPGDLECAVYDVNGTIAFRGSVRLRRVQ